MIIKLRLMEVIRMSDLSSGMLACFQWIQASVQLGSRQKSSDVISLTDSKFYSRVLKKLLPRFAVLSEHHTSDNCNGPASESHLHQVLSDTLTEAVASSTITSYVHALDQ